MLNLIRVSFLISTLIFSIKCACPYGYFTINYPCDTYANTIPCQTYYSKIVSANTWAYFFVPVSGNEGDIQLDIENNGWKTSASFRFFDSSDSDGAAYHRFYRIDLEALEKGEGMFKDIKTSGKEGNVFVGIFNEDSTFADIKIRYFTQKGECKRPLPWGVVIGFLVGVAAVFAMIRIYKYCQRRLLLQSIRGEDTLILNQIIIPRVLKPKNLLTPEEIQQYFPKTPFNALENSFHQTTCSVCLEEFAQDTICRQIYCSHIFHDKCVQIWLSNQNSCPSCRVRVTKKAIQEFLKAKAIEAEMVKLPEEQADITIPNTDESVLEEEASQLEKKLLIHSK